MKAIQELFTELFSWGSHPAYSEGTVIEWLAGLVLVIVAALLWKQVTDSID